MRTKLTTSTLQICIAHQKYALKIDFLLVLGVHLQLSTINYAPKIFIRPMGCMYTSAPPATAMVCRLYKRLCALLRRLKFSVIFLRHLVPWQSTDIQV